MLGQKFYVGVVLNFILGSGLTNVTKIEILVEVFFNIQWSKKKKSTLIFFCKAERRIK